MTNFFAALDDSDDEHEQQVQKKQPEKKKTVTSTKKATVSAPVKSESQQRRPHHNDRSLKSGRGGGSRSERERQPPRDGKRAYERRSGTGRGKEIKKSGGGARNWGSDKDAARNAEGMVFDEKENGKDLDNIEEVGEQTGESGGEDGTPGEQENGDAAEAEPEKEEEVDNTMTYEEYLAQKEEQRNQSDAFKPVEMRELENEFAGLVGKKGRKEEEAEDFLKMGKGKQLKKKGGEKKEKEKIVANFRVQDSNAPRRNNRRDGDRPRGGRGGRGYDRRGPRKGTGQVDVADMSSFPSL